MADPRNNPRFAMRTPRSIVTGLGSTGHGFQHFWLIRITAFIGMFMMVGCLIIVWCLIGKSYNEAVQIVANPFAATVLALMFVTLAIHMKIGFQAIIEDYIRCRWLQVVLTLGNIGYCTLAAVISLAALVRIVAAGSGVNM
jgi:succinate dehydrogenase, hydrophobic membrane anchor protein